MTEPPRLQRIRYASDPGVQRFVWVNALSIEPDALCPSDIITIAVWRYGEERCEDLVITVH